MNEDNNLRQNKRLRISNQSSINKMRVRDEKRAERSDLLMLLVEIEFIENTYVTQEEDL